MENLFPSGTRFHFALIAVSCVLCTADNDLTIGWQNLNLLSHPNATLVPQAREARASGENLNYVALAPQTRQSGPSGGIFNYLLSH